MKRFYYIIARRSSNEVVYFCSSPTQGQQMIPRALSMACRFEHRKDAKELIPSLANKYKGLSDWKINTACEDWIK